MIYDRWESGGYVNAFDLLGFIPRLSLLDLIGVPVASILSAAALFLAALKAGHARPKTRGIAILFAAFLVWCGLSAVFSENRFGALSTFTIFVDAFVLGGAVCMTARNTDAAKFLSIGLSGAATYISAIGVQEYILQWRESNALWRVFAGFVNPDFLAGFLLVVLPLAAAHFLLAKSLPGRVLAGIALLLQTACLVLTGSRLGMAALAVELLVFAVLAWRSGALRQANRPVLYVAAGLMLVTLVGAGGPLLKRVLSSGSESHSARFRVLTWKGTARLVAAKPVLGSGVGTFETAYPPYQVVGYTQHAHNGFLQLAGETGFPGAALLIVALAATIGYGAKTVLKRQDGAVASPADLLTSACVAGVAGVSVHNFFDSDFYVPAVAFPVATLVGLIISRLHSAEPETTSEATLKTGLRPAVLGAGALLALLLWQSGTTAAARISANGAALDYQTAQKWNPEADGDQEARRAVVERALSGYKSALSLQPANFDYALKLANLYEATGQRAEAEKLYRETAEKSRLGKAYYRLGRFLSKDRSVEGREMLLNARAKDPNNLTYLLRLAETSLAVGNAKEAEDVYTHMIRLYRSDFGAVRPMPELVDWEFGVAYVGLAQIQLADGRKSDAITSLEEGAGILGEFWRSRHLQIAEIRVNQDVRTETSGKYESALTQLVTLYEEAGRKSDADKARDRLAEYRKDREEDVSRQP
jgi:putative inorganic carbon (HCO3(-)) transporter